MNKEDVVLERLERIYRRNFKQGYFFSSKLRILWLRLHRIALTPIYSG